MSAARDRDRRPRSTLIEIVAIDAPVRRDGAPSESTSDVAANLLEEEHVCAEPREPFDPVEHHARIAAVVRLVRDHAAHDDRAASCRHHRSSGAQVVDRAACVAPDAPIPLLEVDPELLVVFEPPERSARHEQERGAARAGLVERRDRGLAVGGVISGIHARPRFRKVPRRSMIKVEQFGIAAAHDSDNVSGGST